MTARVTTTGQATHSRRRRRRLAAGIAVIGAAVLAVPIQAGASSHREAPLIAQDPEADNTDVYAFTSPDNASTVTLVANYVPLQRPAGGPNFYPFADDVDYRINVDNVGDGLSHVQFDFRFTTTTVNPNTFLYNTGPITWDPVNHVYTNWNRPQVYTLTMTTSSGTTTLGSNLLTPPDAVGTRSTGDPATYHALASHAIHALGGGVNVFAGQRDDPFFVDLGGIFDLLTLPPFGSPGEDYLTGLNVDSLVLQVPKSMLRGPNDSVIGVWASALRPGTTTLSTAPPFRSTGGGLVQVSRLGNPLVNEVISDLAHKDQYNASAPTGDKALLENRVLNPELAVLLNAIFGAGAPTSNRTDLVAVLLTGISGINKPSSGSAIEADELRLNMDTAVTHPGNINAGNRLGLLAGEGDGFPNGRRLVDDVTDIEIQAVDGILCQSGGPFADGMPCRSGSVPPSLGDGVNANDVPFQDSFPYVADPHSPDTPGPHPTSLTAGYWLAASDGGIFPFGAAPGIGSLGNVRLNKPIVGIAGTEDHQGYWMVASDGGVFPFGDAGGFGSLGNVVLNKPIVALVPTSSGKGYWLIASDGGVFPFGDAAGYGSLGNVVLNKPVVGASAAPGGGYWLAASDGGVFPFGPGAPGFGSLGNVHLNKPVVGIATAPLGMGYWMVASDGGVFPFGPTAGGFGSTGALTLNKPMVGMSPTGDGLGYWLVAADGGIFPFGDAGGLGSTGNLTLNKPIVGMAGFGSH